MSRVLFAPIVVQKYYYLIYSNKYKSGRLLQKWDEENGELSDWKQNCIFMDVCKGLYIISYLIMILEEAEVILIHTNTENPKKRHTVTILPTTTFKQFQDNAKRLYDIKENQIDLIIQPSNRKIALNQYNFQAYKRTIHINKRIKVKEYDVLSLTYIAPLNKKQEKTLSEIIIVPSDLKSIPESQALYDYSSFFADDFHTIVPFLEAICPLKPDIQYSEEEMISLNLIQHLISNSIKPAIEDFCSNPGNIGRLANQ